MAGVPVPAKLVLALVAYAAAAIVGALAYVPEPLDGAFAMLMLLVGPFVLGALSRRPWVAFAIFSIVLATAVLPDRTVVETTANSTTFTVHATSWVVTFPFAFAAAVCAWMGATMRLGPRPAA